METTFRIDLFVFLNVRPPQPKASTKTKPETPNKKEDEADDNWDHFDVELPY